MKDLVDIHRAAIAEAGVKLAKSISDATSEYSADVAASEMALAVAMENRISAFNGVLAIEDKRAALDAAKGAV